MALWVLRAIFVLIAISLGGAAVSNSEVGNVGGWVIFTISILISIGVVLGDWFIKRKRIDFVSSVYFGLIVGLILTVLVGLILVPMFQTLADDPSFKSRMGISPDALRFFVISFVGLVLSYLSISILWQTKDDFRFIIPYVEFAKDVKGAKPYILDTSVVIDGRIADIVDTGIIDNQLIMPRFVLQELQGIADSSDKMRRSRGRRGLDVLNKLRTNENVDFKVYDRELPEMKNEPVDMKLLILARHLEGKVVTGDFNLNKVARLQNVPVINLNEIANTLKPVFLPGEVVKIKVVKPGESNTQGVGYLDDGTMIVIEEGRDHIGKDVIITVTSMLQTSAGRMVFGKFENLAE
jgi:uncharacterized protein YacL